MQNEEYKTVKGGNFDSSAMHIAIEGTGSIQKYIIYEGIGVRLCLQKDVSYGFSLKEKPIVNNLEQITL